MKIRGISRYTLNLLKSLALEKDNITLYLISEVKIDEKTLAQIKVIFPYDVKIYHNKYLPSLIWLNLQLPLFLFLYKINIYHTPLNRGIPIIKLLDVFPTKMAVTIHDTIAIEEVRKAPYSIKKGLFLFEWWMNRTADYILTVSQHSKEQLIHIEKFEADKITVIANSVSNDFFNVCTEESTRSYFLYVGGFEHRKNVPFLLKTYCKYLEKEQSPIPLKLIGKITTSQIDNFKKLNSSDINNDLVDYLGYVDDAQLPKLYRNALAIIIPSLNEGFGLQAIEAMATATPLLSSDAASLPEVGADAPLYFSPISEQSLLKQMLNIQNNKSLIKEKELASFKRAQDFTEKIISSQYLSFLKMIN